MNCFLRYGRPTKVGFTPNPVSANPTKWSDTLKQFVGNSLWSVFDNFVALTLKVLISAETIATGSHHRRYPIRREQEAFLTFKKTFNLHNEIIHLYLNKQYMLQTQKWQISFSLKDSCF